VGRRASSSTAAVVIVTRPPSRHRVARVDDQVHHAPARAGRDPRSPARGAEVAQHQLDVLADQPLQHLGEAADQLGQRGELGRQHLLAAEREQLAGQALGAPRRGQHLLEIGAQRVLGVEIADREIGVRQDHAQAGC
jgi:hypothetical protein